MSTSPVSRPANAKERFALDTVWRAHRPTRFALEECVVMWAVLMLAFMLLWLAGTWLGNRLFQTHVGLATPITFQAAAIALVATAAFSAYSSLRRLQSVQAHRRQLRTDIDNGQVLEQHLVFTAAKRFQEPEHGGLIYFLHAADGRVFTYFDSESQDLGVQDKDPLTSGFVPRAESTIVRAPLTGLVLDLRFAGPVLEVGPPLPLMLDPEQWPEDGDCDVPWSALEAHFGNPPERR